jgi:hypothetical protein
MLHKNEQQKISAHDLPISLIIKKQSENPGSCPENAVFLYLLGCDVKSHPTATILLSVCAM